MSSKEYGPPLLDRYIDLLRNWSSRLNLVSARDLHLIRERHIADSLQLVPLLPPGVVRGIDLGSGAGFPGLILALATGIPFDLVEADQRKAAFLREAARVTGAPVAVHPQRIEQVALDPANVVTARALAPLPKLLPLVAPKLRAGGVALLPKGVGYARELTAAEREWQMNLAPVPSSTTDGAVILRISDLRRVPSAP